ncbi:acyl-CoA dehydrogenase family protein [Streptomyces sp. NPDC001982]|uniref:acyl-CoA dehydrogenase family protein n=1 Tax=Streptomyces sp. NPDC001982 TaxID=3154405 RepID=UPI0033166923
MIDLADSPEEAAFRLEVQKWVAANADRSPDVETMPGSADVTAWRAWSRRIYDAGLAGVTWPKEFGGRGLSHACQAIWGESIADAGVADHLGLVGMGMAGPTIIECGSDEQKRMFLDATLRCDIVWCQGFSEPGSGSDLASIRTGARLDGDHWVVSGQKVWSSWAHIADWCILLVRTDPAAPTRHALSYLLVDMRSPGVTVRPLRQLTGDPEFNEVFFDDVRVPVSMTVGRPGDGWQVAMTTLKHERATLGLGLASRLTAAVDSVIELVTAPNGEGRTPADDEDLIRRLVDVWIDSQSLRMLNLRVVSALSASDEPPAFGSVTKLRWSEANQRLMQIACDAVWSSSVVEDAPGSEADWTFQQLRSRGNTIEAGTSEVLRSIIAERVLHLPKSR